MKLSHLLVAAIVIAVVVLVKIIFFPRPLFGSGHGSVKVVVRIDPRAAAQIRAWRRAHGLDPALEPAAVQSAKAEGDLSDFVSSCKRSGHAVALHRHEGERVAICK
jgi:hypothetical protein